MEKQSRVGSPKSKAERLNSLGVSAFNNGDRSTAVDSFRKAVTLHPEFIEAQNNLGALLYLQGNLEEAAVAFEKAISLNPGIAGPHYNLGNIYRDTGRTEVALRFYERALAIQPEYSELSNNMGLAFEKLSRYDEALSSYGKAISLNPTLVEAHINSGNLLKELGRLEEAVASYRTALRIKPDSTDAYSNLILSSNYDVAVSREDLCIEAARYGEVVAANAQQISRHLNRVCPDRRLRVGLMSGDLHQHPVGIFLEGVLAAANPEVIEIYAYSTTAPYTDDDVSERIKNHVASWRCVTTISDKQLAKDINEDQIDILIDLSGHTAHNRLALFAWKPAPVQATWLGYFATTGVKEIDYILCDRWVFPEEDEEYFVEKPIRLPDSYLCFTPPNVRIDVEGLPADRNGYITFGCFNYLTKINEHVISAWSRVLHAVSDSRLLLKTRQLDDDNVCQQLYEQFSIHGIGPGRLILEGHSTRERHLAKYNSVDIALDPFPYPGGTTSVEALYMGVPVLTLRGDRFLTNIGESILQSVGLPDWIASNLDEYVEIAQKKASQLESLKALRADLRSCLLASPICDHRRFARNLEAGLRKMWHGWCEEQRASEI